MPTDPTATAATVAHGLDVVRDLSNAPGTPRESWVATCKCGWRGHPRYSTSEAISDYRWHQ